MFLRSIANLLFPPVCVHCKQQLKDGTICLACFFDIKRLGSLFCVICHVPKQISDPPCAHGGITAGAAARYEGAVPKLIHALKFGSRPRAAEPLAALITYFMLRSPENFRTAIDFIIPIPLSRRRRWTRGYNQAQLIASLPGDYFKIPLRTDILYRARNTPPQSSTEDAHARTNNLENAFAIQSQKHLRGARILLVDDVITTGATCAAAANALKNSGAASVVAIAAAKT